MACNQVFVLLIAVAAIFPSIALATEFTVGDDKGWMLGVNYTTWAQGKVFKVGDSLVFNYNATKHNVIKVGGPDFRSCTAPAASNPLTSGKDAINLASPGNKWYICGKGNHCESGMKLVITVVSDMEATPPAAPPSSSSSRIVQNLMIVAAAVAAALIMF